MNVRVGASWPVLFLASVLVVACDGSSGLDGAAGQGLAVVGTEPADAATEVPTQTAVIAECSAPLDPASVTADTFIVQKEDGHGVVGGRAVDGRVATWTPSSALALFTPYTATLTTEIQDLAGDALKGDHSWSFHTRDGEWRDVTMLESNDDGPATRPEVAVDADGNAIVVWVEAGATANRVWASRYVPTAGWEEPELIEVVDVGGARFPKIAVSPDGDAIVVWQQSDGVRSNIMASRFAPTDGWSAPELVETSDLSGAFDPDVSIDPAGNAIAVWTQSDGEWINVWSNRFSPAAGWGTPETIATDDDRIPESPRVALDTSGNAVVVWHQRSSDPALRGVWSNRYAPTMGWSAAVRIDSMPGNSGLFPKLAMDPSGNAIAVWAQGGIWANRFTPSNGWGDPEPLATPDEDDDNTPIDPQVGVDRHGNAIVAWRLISLSSNPEPVLASRFTASVGWAPPVQIDAGDDRTTRQHTLGVDPDGRAIAVWVVRASIWANRFTPAEGWGTPESIGSVQSKFPVSPEFPRIVLDSTGRATVTWQQSDGLAENIWAARFDDTGFGGASGEPPPPSVEQTCRDWCTNEPGGPSCNPDAADVETCTDACLQDYRAEAALGRGQEWIVVKECELAVGCADSPLRCRWAIQVVDRSEFDLFAFEQAPGIDFIPAPDLPGDLAIERVGDDEYELRFTTIQPVEVFPCEPPLYLDGVSGRCFEETVATPRLLTPDEINELKELSAPLALILLNDLGCDPLVVERYRWDDDVYGASDCDPGFTGPWIHPVMTNPLRAFVRELIATN